MKFCCLTTSTSTNSFRHQNKRKRYHFENCSYCIKTRLSQAVKNSDFDSVNDLCDEIHGNDEIFVETVAIALTKECDKTLPIVSMLLNRMQELPLSLIRLSVAESLDPEIFALLVKKWIQIDENTNYDNTVTKTCFLAFLRTLMFESRYMFGDRQFRFIYAIKDHLAPYWSHALQHAISARGCQYRLYRLLIAYTERSDLQSCLNNAIFMKNDDAIKALSYFPFLRIEASLAFTRKSASTILFRELFYRIRGVQRFRGFIRNFIERHYAPGGKGYKKSKDHFLQLQENTFIQDFVSQDMERGGGKALV
jgi:hypothetical protein